MEMMKAEAVLRSGASPANSAEHVRLSRSTDALTQLQNMARTVSVSIPPARSLMTLQVFFVAGAATPWRLVETARSAAGKKIRLLCFDSLDKIRRCVEECCAWQRADEEFAAKHMTTPGGFPGVTADWVSSKDFEQFFGPQRNAIRLEVCTTLPDRIVTLRA